MACLVIVFGTDEWVIMVNTNHGLFQEGTLQEVDQITLLLNGAPPRGRGDAVRD